MSRIWTLWRNLVARNAADADLDAELRAARVDPLVALRHE